MRALATLAGILLFCNAGLAQTIEIKVVGMKDDTAAFGEKKEQCEITFEIKNDSWGTLHRIDVPLNATDDRGRGVDELLSASASNQSFFSWTSIPKGGAAVFEDNVTFKEACKYIASISLDGPVPDRDCAIRQMPESASCSDIIKLSSAVETLKVD